MVEGRYKKNSIKHITAENFKRKANITSIENWSDPYHSYLHKYTVVSRFSVRELVGETFQRSQPILLTSIVQVRILFLNPNTETVSVMKTTIL